ncbi:MAG TPA: ATP-binding cassette domain-containing protein [Bryobacteraceae bacterium]|jgi:ATP-binding cassette subfamily B protein
MRDTRRLIGRCLRHLRPHLRLCPIIGASLLVEAAFYSGLPFSFRYIVDYGLLGRNHRLLGIFIAALLGGAVVATLLGLLRDRLYAKVTAGMLADLRLELFDHLQRLSMDFFATRQSGDILASFSTDLAVVEKAASSALSWAVLPGLDVLAGTALLFVLDWRLALLALLVWPVTVVGPRIFTPRMAEESFRRKEAEAGMLSFVQENAGAQMLVKAFDLVESSRVFFARRVHSVRESMVRVGTLSGLIERSSYVGTMFFQVVLLAAGVYLAVRGRLTVGALASIQAIFLSVSNSVANIAQYFPNLVEALGGLRRIENLLEREPRVLDSGAADASGRWSDIRFRGVRFSYSNQGFDLNDLTFSISRGQSLAMVGLSGSGKSTILALMMRLYDPAAGAIEFDGVDIRKIRLRSLRSRIGYVPQESFLFDLSLRENIRLGRPEASDEEVEAAARAAEIHDFIRQLPQGYETPAGERGGRLSGGQRQRVALARALVRKPDLLILDEVTSALDPATESAIQATLERLRGARTIVSVTHRLQAVTAADRIVVLERGRVAQEGSHEELLRQSGLYRQLWEKQQGAILDPVRRQAKISVERVRQVPVFYGMGEDSLREAASLFRTEEMAEGHTVLRAGETGDRLYVIVRGSVEWKSVAGDRTTQRSVLQDGDCFGESVLLASGPLAETVTTLSHCVFLTMTPQEYRSLRERTENRRVQAGA